MTQKKRQHSPTSKAAHESIKAFKSGYYQKILDGMEKLKVGGTYEEIAKASGIKDSQCWKRLSELEAGGKIYNVGITRVLSSGRKGVVWQLKDLPFDAEAKPVVEAKKKKEPPMPITTNPLFNF